MILLGYARNNDGDNRCNETKCRNYNRPSRQFCVVCGSFVFFNCNLPRFGQTEFASLEVVIGHMCIRRSPAAAGAVVNGSSAVTAAAV